MSRPHPPVKSQHCTPDSGICIYNLNNHLLTVHSGIGIWELLLQTFSERDGKNDTFWKQITKLTQRESLAMLGAATHQPSPACFILMKWSTWYFLDLPWDLMGMPPPWMLRKRRGKCVFGPTFKEQAELESSGEELRTLSAERVCALEIHSDPQQQSSPTLRSWETREGESYKICKEGKSCRADNLTRSEVLPAKPLPAPETSQEGAVNINTQTSPSCLLPPPAWAPIIGWI